MYCDKFYSAANGITIIMHIFSVQLKMVPSIYLKLKMALSTQFSSRCYVQFRSVQDGTFSSVYNEPVQVNPDF